MKLTQPVKVEKDTLVSDIKTGNVPFRFFKCLKLSLAGKFLDALWRCKHIGVLSASVKAEGGPKGRPQ